MDKYLSWLPWNTLSDPKTIINIVKWRGTDFCDVWFHGQPRYLAGFSLSVTVKKETETRTSLECLLTLKKLGGGIQFFWDIAMEIILNVPFTCHISLQNVRYFLSIDATPFPQQYVNIPAKFQLDNIIVIFQLSTSSSFQCILMVTVVN